MSTIHKNKSKNTRENTLVARCFFFFFLSEAAIVSGLAAKPQSRSLRYEKQNPSGTQGRARKVRKFSLFFSRPFEVFETFSVAIADLFATE